MINFDDIEEEITEDEYRKTFQIMRWKETEGNPVCPWCDSHSIYSLRTLYEFKCKDCKKRFSVTTNTIFSGRKCTFRTLVEAIKLAAQGKHLNAWQFSRELFISYKAGYVLSKKIVEASNKEGVNSPPSSTWCGYWQRNLKHG